jgi:hypothetical protein
VTAERKLEIVGRDIEVAELYEFISADQRRAMDRRTTRRVVAAALATSALATSALGAASAQAYTPPKGTPDLAKMTLQPSDLAPGATLLVNSYFPGGLHERDEYDRDWGVVSTTGGVKLQQLQTEITLATSTTWAHAVFGQVPSIYDSSAGRRSLIDNIDAGNGSSATLKDARFGTLRGIGVGQQSMYGSATIATKGSTIAAGFAWVRVDAAIATLVVVAPKAPLADSVTIAIAKTVAAHMKSVLGAQ